MAPARERGKMGVYAIYTMNQWNVMAAAGL